jgi:Cytochrome c3
MSSHATNVETLLMPGKVTHAHEKIEETCTSCHDRSNKVPQATLCLDCHKDVAADLRERARFHGRMPNGGAGECRACHTEHKGRGADIVQFDPGQFDHRLTEFPLEGGHAALDCAACHQPKSAWRKAPLACADCHKRDDVHKAQFSQSCGECHGLVSWSGGKFDHDKTDFKLNGAHSVLSCDACHVGGRYKPTPKTCVGCHATDDVHRGERGADCGKCHSTREWKTAKFDHLKETGYALLGAHADIDCLACHRSGNYKDKIPKDCEGCHRADDAHALRFGPKCEDCHDNDKWHPVDYDHAARHKFALLGAHAKLDCHVCHISAAAKKLPETCEGCHASENPHADKVKGTCANCHGQNSREDVHKGALGEKCESCHSPNGWQLWTFDHAKDAHFPLLGAHSKLQCAACHIEPPGVRKLSQECDACHRKDDRHLGQFGVQCERCHSTYSWKGARIQ